jgi:hypothetical protein
LTLAYLCAAGLTLAAGGRLALVSSRAGSMQIIDIHTGTSHSNEYLPPRTCAEQTGSAPQLVLKPKKRCSALIFLTTTVLLSLLMATWWQ